jgi:hypothetical protein
MVPIACPLNDSEGIADALKFGFQVSILFRLGGPAMLNAVVVISGTVLPNMLVTTAVVTVVVGKVGREEGKDFGVPLVNPYPEHNWRCVKALGNRFTALALLPPFGILKSAGNRKVPIAGGVGGDMAGFALAQNQVENPSSIARAAHTLTPA